MAGFGREHNGARAVGGRLTLAMDETTSDRARNGVRMICFQRSDSVLRPVRAARMAAEVTGRIVAPSTTW